MDPRLSLVSMPESTRDHPPVEGRATHHWANDFAIRSMGSPQMPPRKNLYRPPDTFPMLDGRDGRWGDCSIACRAQPSAAFEMNHELEGMDFLQNLATPTDRQSPKKLKNHTNKSATFGFWGPFWVKKSRFEFQRRFECPRQAHCLSVGLQNDVF